MITDDGEVKLLDFGLAKLTDRPAALPSPAVDALASGQRIGTPLYMAPELWRGEHATTRSDVYSIGVLFYELASAARTQRRGRAHELARVTQEQTSRRCAPSCPRSTSGCAHVIDRCLVPRSRRVAGNRATPCAKRSRRSRSPTRAALPEGNPYRGLPPSTPSTARSSSAASAKRAPSSTGCAPSRSSSSPATRASASRRCAAPACCRACRPGASCSSCPGRRPLAALGRAGAARRRRRGGSWRPIAPSPARWRGVAARRRADLLLFIDQLEELVTLGRARRGAVAAEALAALAVRVAGGCASSRPCAATFSRASPGCPRSAARWRARCIFCRRCRARGCATRSSGRPPPRAIASRSAATVDELVAGAGRVGRAAAACSSRWPQLWEARDDERRLIPAAALDDMGGVAGALARHADTVLARRWCRRSARPRSASCCSW